jgi:hypothetical protein
MAMMDGKDLNLPNAFDFWECDERMAQSMQLNR